MQQRSRSTSRATSSQGSRARRVLFAAAAGLRILAGVAQTTMVSAAHSFGFGPSAQPVRWPHLEDLINND